MRNNKAKQSKADQYNITYKIQMPSLRRDKGDISIRVSFNSIQFNTILFIHRIELLLPINAFITIYLLTYRYYSSRVYPFQSPPFSLA